MVDLAVSEGKLLVNVRGADKVWALKSSLEIPLEHVTGVRMDPTVAKGLVAWLEVSGNARSGRDNRRHLLHRTSEEFFGTYTIRIAPL